MESDHDILIRMDQKLNEVHFQVTDPAGRVPRLESKVDAHDGQLHKLDGAAGMARWIIGLVIALGVGFLGLAGVLLDHILKH